MPSHTSQRNPWDHFWSEYMVWSLRLSCYFSNVLFWDSMKGSLESLIPTPFISDAILWVFSILCFEFLEKTVNRRFNPKYAALKLSDEDYHYRVSRERLLITCWLFCGVNFICGTLASLALHGELSILAIIGLIGLLGASFSTMFGCVSLVARNAKTGERHLFNYVFGFFLLILPAGYIAFMFHYEFIA